ncbi:hypothetical protein CASFOL_019498 [Castilleja foliolosa]|uniref:X8 domain-containing protein n=1 Tax=Castilleja foliolosa TaxID=1961234 RepID=A0ABD3D5T4_9LAMI
MPKIEVSPRFINISLNMSSKTLNIHYHALLIFLTITLSNTNIRTEGVIGINWGRENSQRLIPSMVVDLILQNRVPEARIYSDQTDLLKAFAGSGISLTIQIFDLELVGTPEAAKAWVQSRALWFTASNVRRVFIGRYVFFAGDAESQNSTINALFNTQEALNAAGYGDLIKATMPQPYQILKNITKPSEAEFQDWYKQDLLRFLSIIKANNAPYCLELFPMDTMMILNITDMGFVFPDNKSTHVVTDVNGAVYTDVFTFAYDAYAWALEKLGFQDLKIVVSLVGWPTDGYPGANVPNAERFYKAFLPLIASGKGTPKRPGNPIDAFVHSITDENKNPVAYPFGRHWGIYRSNGEPKYKIDLTGQGRDIFPVTAKGVMQMPRRWCVIDEKALAGNEKKLEFQHERACEQADCTSTFEGGSCSGLSPTQNVSYAFNMLFQSMFQEEDECYFHGLARVVTDNPSTGSCVFPVEVVKGAQENYAGDGAKENYFGDGNRTHEMNGLVFVILLSTLWALIYN